MSSDSDMDSKIENVVEMGFSKEAATIALKQAEGNVERALELLVQKEETSASETPKVAKSFVCTDTGKVFRTMRDAQMYAEKTGHSNFEESEIEVPPLTEEEKAEKVKQLKEKIKQKRAEREAQEKVDTLARERERRKGGQQMAETREIMAAQKRKLEIEQLKKEKQAQVDHRVRLREQIARDKGERAADKARSLGQDPKAAYNEAYKAYLEKQTPAKENPKEKLDRMIEAMDHLDAGKVAMQTLKKLISNIAKSPKEEKYRKIRFKNPGFYKRVGKFASAVGFLKCCGFESEQIEGEKYLVMKESSLNENTLQSALSKLDGALS
mmetsp:Transcript_20302/g.26347  ORF Transcript_20302/g.26347 Transcript_20302/m.26347 type:complete len:325 (+) Transcript_20302:108-1082(+)